MENERNTVSSLENPLVSMVVTPVVTNVATLVVSPAVPVLVPVNYSERLEKFSRLNFKSAVDAWKHSDFLCQNYVLNGLTNSLYNVYNDKKTAKELWEPLDMKYKSEDAGSKKFVVGWFLDYKMVDSKSVISQAQEIQVILHEIHAKWMNLSETFQFKKNKSNKGPKLGPKGGVSKKQKFQGKCFNCDKIGHKSSECRLPKKNKNHEANVVNNITQDVADINMCAVISEVNMVGSNPRKWWIDTGATRHICSNKGLFTSFESMNREKLFMENSATSETEGQGKLVLKMISRKELTLNNVLYGLEIRKNLVSGSLLPKYGFCMVFESDKVVLTKSGMYVGKGYVTEELFKLNVMTVVRLVLRLN
ncbi:hypothetical protein UlMin_026287 [Ulmus minor]